MLRNEQSYLVRLLRWSEKYTKTDMVYLAHGSFWLSGSQIITAGVSFGLALAFANLWAKESYGTYKYILTLFGIFSIACLRGMDIVVTQAAARGNDRTVITGLWAKIRWSVLGSLGALALSAYYFYGGNTPVAISLIFASIFIPMMEPFGIFNAYLVGKKDFKLSSIFGSLGQIAAASALILTLILFHNPIASFITFGSIWTLTRYLSLKYTLRKYPPNTRDEPNAQSYALHSSVIGAAAVLVGSIDAVLIYHYLGATQLALYTFAMAPVLQARAILNAPTMLAVPKLAGKTTAEIRRLLKDRTIILSLIGTALTLGYCLLAYPFYNIFFYKYIDAVLFSMAFSITILFQVSNGFVGAVIESRTTLVPKHLLYLWNVPGLIIAVCAIFLIPVLGLWGAIIGQILSTACSSALNWVMWSIIRHREHSDA